MAVLFKKAELTAGRRMAAGDEFRVAVNEGPYSPTSRLWLFF